MITISNSLKFNNFESKKYNDIVINKNKNYIVFGNTDKLEIKDGNRIFLQWRKNLLRL